MNGVPISERLAIVRNDEVIGEVFNNPPIIRISCSLLRL